VQVRELPGLRDAGALQVDALELASLVEPDAVAEEYGRQVDDDLVEQPGLETLLRSVGTKNADALSFRWALSPRSPSARPSSRGDSSRASTPSMTVRGPEEVVSDASLNGHLWAHLNSFPSGHLAITAALAVGAAIAFPRARYALWTYVAAVGFTRILFGAHFPLDVVAGTALGVASAFVVALALERVPLRRSAAAPLKRGLGPRSASFFSY
jgi:hypothetical protein